MHNNIYIYTSSILYGYKIDRTTDPYGRTTLGCTTHSSDTENPFNSPHLSPSLPYPKTISTQKHEDVQ